MRAFDILKRAVSHDKFADDANDIESLTHDLLTELDSELTVEEYEEGEKVSDLTDKLETELKDVDGEEEEEDEAEDDDDDDDDDEFEGIDEEEE